MARRTVSEEDLARLKRERDEANARYTEALTALDGAKQAPPETPAPPPWPDEHQITPLNQHWAILPTAAPTGTGWRGRLAGMVWRLVGPVFERQQAFNSMLVDHINRSLAVDRETRKAIDSTIQLASGQLGSLVTFEWLLMRYLQQLTPYVDAADREALALMRRIAEDNEGRMEQLADQVRRVDGFAAGLSGVSDELQKRWESLVAHEQRFEGQLAALTNGLPVLQQAVHTTKREVQRLAERLDGAAGPQQAPPEAAQAVEPTRHPSDRSRTEVVFGGGLDAYKYLCFEDKYRGAREDIAERVADYVSIFEGRSGVLDVGCGRGEFLEALGRAGIAARGLDINHEMVELCRSRGLSVHEGDALAYVRSLDDGSLGGLFAAQVVEHLRPDYLLAFLDQGYHKLRPGSPIVLETINPACWYAFFESYLRDLTHVQPIHPDTLKYLLQASGFEQVEVRFRSPFPADEKLQRVPGDSETSRTVNANIEKINRLLFSHLDYAVVGKK